MPNMGNTNSGSTVLTPVETYRSRANSAVLGERLLLGEVAPQRAQACLDDGRLVEIGVGRLRCELELIDCAPQVALPRVKLALMQVLLRLLPELRVRARGDPVQRSVGREQRELALEEGGGVA